MIGPLYDEVEGPGAGVAPLNAGPIELGLPKPDELILPTPASIRSRLHVICALYAHTPQPERRLALLDHLERMTLEAAESLAMHLLASGWRPRSDASEAA
ncbi:hypothetical protein ASE17_03770 [Phenylobacterium sp. Root77]|jgi:hypothetical protein|uniref:hypothetical protein n=1 Tax=unclassified Phenylobacterium TaxID=2640670 RepID=UPI0006F6D9D4|nr:MULTISPECIES: hypothetical protein [unclassified Phenylobacterium]KQW72000.1 hypothetical protein ASC73_07995 [Phenylobacterium sp. Root1277]KQW94921.1 hypothetical protein ASC79_04140 [Phenylobacterium sp. Root1290]KRC44615.1 hypothetical protein ASE17_03770 [Phenylobacterium sp. Root77]